MKIQIRQSIYSSIAFGVVFIIISFSIYILYAQNGRNAIYRNLEKTTHLIALFYLEEDELSAKEFEKVKEQFNEVVSETVYQVYNRQDSVVWGNKNEDVTSPILSKIEKERYLRFSTETDICYGIFYEDNQGDFIIITKESKDILNDQLILLLWILISSLFIGLVAVIILSRWLARIAYRPFSSVIEQVKNISPEDPSNQILSPNTKDELQELTETFNRLLEQISEMLVIRKNFANYVSHEFKTPLTSMLGNLEVFFMKERTPKEYDELSNKLISQIHQLEGILNTLILISDLGKGKILNNQFRIDELIWEIIDKLSFDYVNCKSNIQVDILSVDEDSLIVNKDRTQLLMALFNIIENAVKYSRGEPINVKLYKESGNLYLSVFDKGIGIPSKELENISKPFYRANNTSATKGSGIGLSIALRILEKNNIEYIIRSKEEFGTQVIVIL